MDRYSTVNDLQRIAASVGDRTGWDLTSMRTEREPTLWEYLDVVRPYLRKSSQVLDIGTGGGERFLALAANFGQGVGIDPDTAMLDTARRNTPAALRSTVSFAEMSAEALAFDDETFDIVLNRHAPIHVAEVIRVLRPGGIFITQQVGRRNTHNLCAVFGCNHKGSYTSDSGQDVTTITNQFLQGGCTLVTRGEYDVPYRILDIESLIFWLQAVPIPVDFNIHQHGRQVARILNDFGTPHGIETNEHRELLIVRKRQ